MSKVKRKTKRGDEGAEVEDARRGLCPGVVHFLESSGYIRFEKNTMATSKSLYTAYVIWCSDNAEKPFSERTFGSHLKNNAKKLGIEYDKNISVDCGKTARGYHGVHVQVRTDGYMQMRIA